MYLIRSAIVISFALRLLLVAIVLDFKGAPALSSSAEGVFRMTAFDLAAAVHVFATSFFSGAMFSSSSDESKRCCTMALSLVMVDQSNPFICGKRAHFQKVARFSWNQSDWAKKIEVLSIFF
jgi:hypothetical protein